MQSLVASLVHLWLVAWRDFTLTSYIGSDGNIFTAQRKNTHLVCADNIWIPADNFAMMEAMTKSLTEYINDTGLVWKPCSLKTMSTN